MDHRVHQRNFAQAWRAFLAHKYLWLLGPAAVLLGSGSVLDAAVGAVKTVSDIVHRGDAGIWIEALFLAPAPFIVAFCLTLLLIVLLASVAQAAIVHTLYSHRERAVAHGIHHALSHGLRLGGRVALLQLASLGFNLLMLGTAAMLLVPLLGSTPLWDRVVWIAVGTLTAAVIWFVHSVKLLALQWVVGEREPVPKSIVKALALVRRHPIIILEHTIGLFFITLIGIFFLIPSIAMAGVTATILMPAVLLILLENNPSFDKLEMALPVIMWGIGMLSLGILSVFNLSTWAQLAHRLHRARRPIPSRTLHTLRTYIPILR